MQIAKLNFIAEIIVLILLLLLVLNIYAIWVGLVLSIIVGVLIYTRVRSTVVIPLPPSPLLIHLKELTTKVDFKDDNGNLVHVTKEQLIRPHKGTANEHIDRGMSGTGQIGNFKSFRYINDNWLEIKISSRKIEGAEIAITTPFNPPLSDKTWTKCKLEFDCINCFKEDEESFSYRVDNPTKLFKIIFSFHPNRKPNRIDIFELIGGYKKQLDTIKPIDPQQPTVFKWSKKKPHLASDYFFIWEW